MGTFPSGDITLAERAVDGIWQEVASYTSATASGEQPEDSPHNPQRRYAYCISAGKAAHIKFDTTKIGFAGGTPAGSQLILYVGHGLGPRFPSG